MHTYGIDNGVRTTLGTLRHNRRKVYTVAGLCIALVLASLSVANEKASLHSDQALQNDAAVRIETEQSANGSSTSATIVDIQQSTPSDETSDVFIPDGTPSAVNRSVEVTVNGTEIPVPDNGQVQTSVSDDTGSTSINIESQHSTSGDTSSKQKLRINTRSSSSIESSITEDEQIRISQ